MIHIRKQAGFTSALAFSTHAHTYAHFAYSGEGAILHFHQSKEDLWKKKKPFASHSQNSEMLQFIKQIASRRVDVSVASSSAAELDAGQRV